MLSNNDTNVNPDEVGGSASPQEPWKSVTRSEFRVNGQQPEAARRLRSGHWGTRRTGPVPMIK